MRPIAQAAVLGLAACQTAAPAAGRDDAGTPRLPTVRVIVEAKDGRSFTVTAEVAANDADRARGLMFRKALAPDEGMLFVFPRPAEHRFYMRNTLLPLDMIFAAEDGRVLGVVERAEPRTEISRGVAGPTRFVLEVIGGWSADRGIGAGDRIRPEGVDAVRVR